MTKKKTRYHSYTDEQLLRIALQENIDDILKFIKKSLIKTLGKKGDNLSESTDVLVPAIEKAIFYQHAKLLFYEKIHAELKRVNKRPETKWLAEALEHAFSTLMIIFEFAQYLNCVINNNQDDDFKIIEDLVALLSYEDMQYRKRSINRIFTA